MLTRPQADALRNPGSCSIKQRMGGARYRMLTRLKTAGFVEGPPWIVTPRGETQLRAFDVIDERRRQRSDARFILALGLLAAFVWAMS